MAARDARSEFTDVDRAADPQHFVRFLASMQGRQGPAAARPFSRGFVRRPAGPGYGARSSRTKPARWSTIRHCPPAASRSIAAFSSGERWRSPRM